MPDDGDLPWSDEDAPPARQRYDMSAPPVREAAPIEVSPAVTAPPAVSELDWKTLCDKVSPGLAMDLKMVLGDDSKINGSVSDGLLSITAANNFVYGRFNKQEVLHKFSKAASELCGREIRANLSELNENAREKRSLEDLRAFKEVRFI